ncbi:DUF72 domain-containing protein, partial [Thermodesulfobacteriota bacterium]
MQDRSQGINAKQSIENSGRFLFRDLHPKVLIGTASDRYAGWIGQIYSEERYRATKRQKKVGGKSFQEQVLPVESVEEYFEHFSVLELDFTFYRVLLDTDSKATQNYHVLQTYKKHLAEDHYLLLKVPQVVFAQRLWKGGSFVENPDCLDSDIFERQFYEPAVSILGDRIKGFIFEQEYQPKKDRIPPEAYAEALAAFLDRIPDDDRYHIEIRTESFLTVPHFDLLEKHGIGQVLSHWTWLPPLRKQFLKGDRRFYNSGGQCIIRLMTP